MKHVRIKQWVRRCAAFLCVPLAATVLGRQEWGQGLALVAAGLRSPQSAAALLDRRLTAELDSVATPPTWFEGAGDTTAVDVPVVTPLVELPAITMTDPPPDQGDGGRVIQKTMDTGDRRYGIATINRSGTTVDIAAALERELSVAWEDTDAPQVLILHTHTTEGYLTYDAGYYNAADRHRTDDHSRNVCAVGETVRLTLAAYGITAIHDTTIHDNPVYTGAYGRSAQVAQQYLEQYPSIRVVLDLHRDAVMEGESAIVRPTATVDGRQVAQMMIITGVVSTEDLPHPQWEQNLTLACHWQAALDEVSSDLMRPLNTVASRYNQHLSPGWVLVEVGSEGNTVEEAVYAARILGRTLAELLD